MVPLRLSVLLYGHVRQYAVADLSCSCAGRVFARGSDAALDVQGSLGVGLYRRQLSGVGCTVCLWLLQRDADIYAVRLGGDGAVQAENLVYLLPDGDDDADDLQNEAVEGLG